MRPVAPGPNLFRFPTLRLCLLTLESLPEFKGGKHPEGDKTWFDLAVDRLKLETLKNAYVMLLRTSICGASVEPSVENGFFARTDQEGELLCISELSAFQAADFDKKTSTRVFFDDNEELLYFWTLSKHCFTHVLKAARSDFQKAVRDYHFEYFRMTDALSHTQKLNEIQDTAENPFELLDSGKNSSARLGLIRDYLVGAATDGNYRGYYPGYAIQLWHKSPEAIAPRGNYLIAGSRVINALYLAELAYYHAISLPQRYAADFATFGQVKEVVAKSESGERYPALDRATQTFRIGGMSFEYAAWKEYRNYAYICARNTKIKRELFIRAVDIVWYRNYQPWIAAAEEIRAIEPSAIHPIDHRLPNDRWRTMELEHVLALFDFYRFGTEFGENGWYETLADTENRIKDDIDEVCSQIGGFLGRHVTRSALAVHLEMRFLLDPHRRKELWARYLNISDQCEYDWSENSEAELHAESILKKFVEWSGALMDKLDEALDEHYRKIENIQKVMENLEGENEAAVAGFIRRVADWNDRIGRRPKSNIKIEPGDHHIKSISLAIEDVDRGRGKAVIRAATADGEKVAFELDFLETTIEKPVKRLKPTRRTQHWKRPRYQLVDDIAKKTKIHLQPKFQDIPVWPKGLVVFGETIGLSLSTKELLEEVKKKSNGEIGTALAKVGRDTFQVIDSSSDLVAACLSRSGNWLRLESGLVRVSKIAKGPGLLLEVYVNLRDGAQILEMGEDSTAVQASAEGEEVIATLQTVKGAVLIVGTTSGLVAGAAAIDAAVAAGLAESALGAASLGFPPLAIALAVTCIIVVIIDFAIYFISGPSNVMEELLKDLRKASEREYGCEWVTKRQPEKHRTFEAVHRFKSHVLTLLK